MIAIFSKGMWELPHLSVFLGEEVTFRPAEPQPGMRVAGWGMKPSTQQAKAFARKHTLPWLAVEDGFLRSLELGVNGASPLSLVVDDLGIYYDATRPSRLENTLNSTGWEDAALLSEADQAIAVILENNLSKYNHAPDVSSEIFANSSRKRVLVLDQTNGDMSVQLGLGDSQAFANMLRAAVTENPEADIFVKLHPDVIVGKKAGYFSDGALGNGVRAIVDQANPISLLRQVDHVYTVSSQMGFEALMLGKQVTCFGMPFYAGWGLTDDRITCSRRTRKRTLSELFAAAYILYPHYVNPYTGQASDIHEIIRILSVQRQYNEMNRGLSVCLGFSGWKQPHAQGFLSSTGGSTIFTSSAAKAVEIAREQGGRIVVWASKEPEGLADQAARAGVRLLRMEDGFLRSAGLGSDFHTPFSLILDESGIYYDATQASDLEHIINKGQFSEKVLSQARSLREKIVSGGVTKYNVGSHDIEGLPCTTGQNVVLVPGQVESDASIKLGSPEIKTNLGLLQAVRSARPDDYIIYKPHPDVEAGNRPGKIDESVVLQWCDRVVNRAAMGSLLHFVDEVHTMTSLTGFEALLRGKRVQTYGAPFYAGWGFTIDRISIPRRTRRATLDEVLAAAFIMYPSYYDWKTGAFCGPEEVLIRISEKGSIPCKSKKSASCRRVRFLRFFPSLIQGTRDCLEKISGLRF